VTFFCDTRLCTARALSRGGTPHSSLKSIQVVDIGGILARLQHMQVPATRISGVALGTICFQDSFDSINVDSLISASRMTQYNVVGRAFGLAPTRLTLLGSF
jgi:hypothetical protein